MLYTLKELRNIISNCNTKKELIKVRNIINEWLEIKSIFTVKILKDDINKKENNLRI